MLWFFLDILVFLDILDILVLLDILDVIRKNLAPLYTTIKKKFRKPTGLLNFFFITSYLLGSRL